MCSNSGVFFCGGAFPISRQGAKADKLSRRGEERNFKTSYRITSHFGPDEESPRDHFPKQEEPPFINHAGAYEAPLYSRRKNHQEPISLVSDPERSDTSSCGVDSFDKKGTSRGKCSQFYFLVLIA